MSLKKKIVSIIAAAAIAVSMLTGCNPNVSTAMTVNGADIPAGLYILYSGHAYADAMQKISEEQPDLDTSAEDFDYYAQTVDGVSFADFVKREAVNYCKRHVAVNKLFDSLGLEFDAEDRDTINDYFQAQWDYNVSNWSTSEGFTYLNGAKTMGEYYESIGISKTSFREYNYNNYRASEIFTHYYGEGGTEEVPKADIYSWIEDNYSLARYFTVSLLDSEGNQIEDEAELKTLEDLANEYKDKLNDDGSFAEVYAAHQKYTAAKEAEESGEEAAADETASTDNDRTDNDFNSLISKTSTSPSEEFVSALFEQEKNTTVVFKADTAYYVVQKLDITATDGADGEDETDYVARYTHTALQDLKGDDLEDVFKNEYASYSLEENASAPDYSKEQAGNAVDGLTTITQIEYQLNYYSQLMQYGFTS